MEPLGALLTHSSVSLLTQDSPWPPTGWQLQANPTWDETTASIIFNRGEQASPLRLSGDLRGSFHPPGSSSFQTGSLTCDPSSQLRAVLAPGSGLSSPQDTRRAQSLGPNCSSCGSSFQMGRGGAPGAPGPVLASVGTQQWLPGDLQVIKGQKGKGILGQILRGLILHIPQQRVGTCLAQGG